MLTASFAAMGTSGHLQIIGPRAKALAKTGIGLVDACERRWSRFLPDSDVSRINRAPGHDVAVDPTTIELLTFALGAWEGTRGTFSPFLGMAMNDIGYSRSWSAGTILHPESKPNFRPLAFDVCGMPAGRPLVVDVGTVTARIACGVRLDLGGVAKGYTADLVRNELLAQGAESVLVDLGGDMAFTSNATNNTTSRSVTGHPPWRIAVDDPFAPGTAIDAVVADAGGVATSSTLRRRWNTPTGESLHHVIDPATGRSTASDIAAISVVADTCAHAEVLAKQLINVGRVAATHEATRLGVDALIVGYDGTVDRIGVWDGANR